MKFADWHINQVSGWWQRYSSKVLPAIGILVLAVGLGIGVRMISNTRQKTILKTQASSQINPLQGIYAIREYKDDKNESFADQTYQNPNITGLALRIGWKTIKPDQDNYDWSVLDELFAKSATNHKQIILIIVPGFDTPAWALAGVQTGQFMRKYGAGADQVEALPLPWDQTYLSRWYTFLKAIAARYGNNPQFRMISAAGPTSVSVEMSLPNTDADITQWISLGYTPSKYITAWQEVFQHFSQIFPKQLFSLALYPGLPINNLGQIDNSQRSLTRQRVIDLGFNNYPSYFALQTSGLHAGSTDGDDDGGAGYDIVRSYNGQILTGFQMSTSATRNPEKMGDATNPANALKLSVDKGLVPNSEGEVIKYLEIYEPDILNSTMQSVLAYAQQTLLSQPPCLPPRPPRHSHLPPL